MGISLRERKGGRREDREEGGGKKKCLNVLPSMVQLPAVLPLAVELRLNANDARLYRNFGGRE